MPCSDTYKKKTIFSTSLNLIQSLQVSLKYAGDGTCYCTVLDSVVIIEYVPPTRNPVV